MPARSSSKKVVKYTGLSDVREISKASWEAIGIDDQETVVWNWKNDWAVPVADLSEGALNYAKNVDDELKIIDADGGD